MKFAVDKIENDIVILENVSDNSILEVNVKNLPEGIKECDIVRLENNKYVLDNNEKNERLRRIKLKMESLKRRD